MPASRIITCEMVDENGVYNGPWDLGINNPPYAGDYVFKASCPEGCDIHVNGDVHAGGSIKGMDCVRVTVGGDASGYSKDFPSGTSLTVQGMSFFVV